MKCEVCENEISENTAICERCSFDSSRNDFKDHRKLQTYYKTIKSDHWGRGLFLIGSVYNVLSRLSDWGAQSKCAEILNISPGLVSGQLTIYKCLVDHPEKFLEIIRLKTFSQAKFICEQYQKGIPIKFVSEDEMQDYFVCNWDKFAFTREWELIKDTDNGRYRVGRDLEIDLLAKHKIEENHWLVIELKLVKAEDKVIHQVSRYMNWIREEKLPEEDGNVKGWIIAGKPPNKSLSRYIEKDYPDLKYFIYRFDKNKNLCLEGSKRK